MATTVKTETKLDNFGEESRLISWASMGDADTGEALEILNGSVRSVQIAGTFGSATVVLEGSLDGSNYITLNDLQGSAISKTAAGLEGVAELTRYVRPKTSGGTGTSITVTVLVRKK